ncbi:MAG: hypothetical protein LBJ67_07875 [Planctomycetaceae bacterium]|jgi:hypothetical protein|nr:hypothetical protein [Planctomycetaceae bacterium]
MQKTISSDNWDNAQVGTWNVPVKTELDEELLIAYLDGELDSQNVRQMEDRLSREPELREKMTVFEQTWNLLDSLETVPVDKELVRSTMEVVTLTIEKELNEGEKKLEQRKIPDFLITLAILMLCGMIGYQLMSLYRLSVDRQILDDIPIIQQMNTYKEIGNFDFLKELAKERVFDTPSTDTKIQETLEEELTKPVESSEKNDTQSIETRE